MSRVSPTEPKEGIDLAGINGNTVYPDNDLLQREGGRCTVHHTM